MKIKRAVEPEDDHIRRQWLEFHADNPHVYRELVTWARRRVRTTGATRLSINQAFEVLRDRVAMQTRSEDGFKLNNNYRALYSREIMVREPDLRGLFEVRERTSLEQN